MAHEEVSDRELLTSIHFKFDIKLLVLEFLIGWSSVDWWLVNFVSSRLIGGWWSVVSWSVGRWSVGR